ncbi:hypothetical protein JCM3775_000187 [Rhodotorula graminis]|uniref:Acyl-protein thioesterase 1 n=1 Tax=Rhodotorula graminis (strain WP1) TaxID=578459 RepID=A0A194S6X7_RHOGW|nr:uncharacterized protein RHOBADRAFT_52368 [Rhodotorula graminis WP1]KPV76347.1 hypothetical protein RHOBADRAFT_52368 [Rhodotorula graminis WP1]
MSKAARSPKLRWIALGALAVFGLYHLAGPSSSSSSSTSSSPASGLAFAAADETPFPDEVWAHAKDPETDVEVLGVGRHSATIIFIHGLGGNAEIVLPLVARLRPKLWQVAWVLPNSPQLAFTGAQGETMSAWFDMDELLLPDHAPMPKREDEKRMRAAVDRIHGLIQKELDRGIDPDRIVLAGFSQGCATTLLSGLSWSGGKLGGLMCLSGWLPMAYDIKKQGSSEKHPMQSAHANELPVFWGHGAADKVIQYQWAEESIGHLTKMGFKDVQFHTYPELVHWVGDDEEDDMLAWFSKMLPQT